MERAELEALLGERATEGREVEHVLPRVDGEAAQEITEHRRVELLPRQVLEEEDAARTQHPPHLRDRLPAARDVVEDRELEGRVVAAVLGIDALGLAHQSRSAGPFDRSRARATCASSRSKVSIAVG